MPGSWAVGSRTAQISPSPEDRPVRIRRSTCGSTLSDQLADVIPGGALSGLGAVADEEHELVGVMPGRLDGEPGAAADGGAEGDQQLGEDRDRVGLGVRRDRCDDLAEALVVDGRGWRRGPARRRRERGIGRLRVLGRRVAAARGSFGGDLGDRGAGGRLVDDRLLLCERGDQRGDGEVVDQARQAAGDLVDERDRVVAEQRVRAAGEREVVRDVAGRLGGVEAGDRVADRDPLIQRGERAPPSRRRRVGWPSSSRQNGAV